MTFPRYDSLSPTGSRGAMFVVDKKQIRAAIIHEEAVGAYFSSRRGTMRTRYSVSPHSRRAYSDEQTT